MSLEAAWAGQARATGVEVGPVTGLWLDATGGDRGIAWGDGRVLLFDAGTGRVERNAVKVRAVSSLLGGGVPGGPPWPSVGRSGPCLLADRSLTP